MVALIWADSNQEYLEECRHTERHAFIDSCYLHRISLAGFEKLQFPPILLMFAVLLGKLIVMSKIALRNIWFQFHKWIGLLLAIVIIPISVTGAALVWHDALDEALHPSRFAETIAPKLTPSAYVAAAKSEIGAEQRIFQLAYSESGTAPLKLVLANPAQSGERRPVRTTIWLDPADGHPIDTARSDAGPIRFMHVLHGSLFIPAWGRPIVGWIGVAMLISSISGLWLWWPTVGRWIKGLRWKRHRNFDTNLHHQMGFWISIPLFILSATGVWISFPKVFASFEMQNAKEKPSQNRDRSTPSQPLESTQLSVDEAVAAALKQHPLAVTTINWPTEKSAQWEIKGEAKNGDGKPTTLTVNDINAEVAIKQKEPDSRGPIAKLMRQIHDGTDTGFIWQFIIFLGGLLPALLAVTGIIMWWRARGWRGDLAARQKQRKPTQASS